KTFRFENRDIAAMRKALKGDLAPVDAMHFRFALGKAMEDRDVASESFAQYALANQIKISGLPPSALVVTPRVDSAIATFDAELFERHEGSGEDVYDPIFIVGLQRSGSTLLEQILASHPMVEGTTELPTIE